MSFLLTLNYFPPYSSVADVSFKGAVMQIEKALLNNRLRVTKVS